MPTPDDGHRYTRDSSKKTKVCMYCGEPPAVHANVGSRVGITVVAHWPGKHPTRSERRDWDADDLTAEIAAKVQMGAVQVDLIADETGFTVTAAKKEKTP